MSPPRKIPSLRRTCWSVAAMAQIPLIRCILGAESFRSMIFRGGFMGDAIKYPIKVSYNGNFLYLCKYIKTLMQEQKFRIILTGEARDFLESLSLAARKKITYNIRRVMGGEINNELFKKLENSDGIWEFRTKYSGIAYRLFAFWDTESETLVIATHGIIKKTQKTPSKEIAKAERIKQMYFARKAK